MTRDRLQIVTFAVGDELFAFDVREVERVLPWRAPTPVPNLPDWLAGVLEHGPASIPVIDLRRRFELPWQPLDVQPRIVVVGGQEARIGTVVDRVLDVTPVTDGTMDAPPPIFRGLPGEYVRGLVRRDGRVVIVLAGDRLLTATERLALDQLGAAQDPTFDSLFADV